MREKQEQGCRQEMGQDGEQKPGGEDTGSWKRSGRGRLGVGFGVHLGCESIEVKPKKA